MNQSDRKAVGILAVQGDFELHSKMLDRLGARWKLVKHATDLNRVAGLIMPGGESTTMLKFLSSPAESRGEAAIRPRAVGDPPGRPYAMDSGQGRIGARRCLARNSGATEQVGPPLGVAICQFAAQGKPIFGTCAGAILLAKEVLNAPQDCLGLIDITIERNAYGRQIDSAVRRGDCPELSARPLEMVFIRAPIIRRVGEGVRVLGRSDGLPVLVEQGNIVAATFHPELTDDETIHRYFLGKMGL